MARRHAAPVRRRLTVLKGGAAESCDIVFCEAAQRSLPVSRCRTCPFAGPSHGDTPFGRLVDCDHSMLPIDDDTAGSSFPPAVAAALPVGLALARSVVCVADDLPWAEASRALLLAGDQSGLPVVDRTGALLGVVPRSAIELAHRDGLEEMAEPVIDRIMSATYVRETESLGDAFAAMGARRAREIIAVGDGLIVVGVLRDLDALHFVSHVARTGSRPPAPDRAA